MTETHSSMVPYGYQWHGCGYCGSRSKREQTSPSFYAESEEMTSAHYQILADRGWRRSGTTYYKPDLRNSCCPHYSIRLDAKSFKPSPHQRKAVNVFSKHVLGLEYKNKLARLAPRTREEKRRRKQVFDVREVIHEPDYDALRRPADPKNGSKPVEPAHKLTVTLESDELTEEKYALFENYQRTVHKEPPHRISRDGFKSFLCSGLPRTKDRTGKWLGSYHQCYRLDGELIAMGVLDLLPHAVSSVYVMYRDDVACWQFGKLSALREIALTLEGGYDWYYMGYYIHGCAKMKYKADYKPQYVLDVVATKWHMLDHSFWNAVNAGKFVTYNEAEQSWKVSSHKSADDYGDPTQLPKSIWKADFAGVPSAKQLVEDLPLRDVPCRAFGGTVALEDVMGPWDVESIEGGRNIKSLIAQMAACLGTDFAKEMAVNLRPFIE